MKEQKFKFVDVILHYWDDTDNYIRTVIALMPQHELGFDDNDGNDNQITYYCNNGYEEFLEMINEMHEGYPEKDSKFEFQLVEIIGLYEGL